MTLLECGDEDLAHPLTSHMYETVMYPIRFCYTYNYEVYFNDAEPGSTTIRSVQQATVCIATDSDKEASLAMASTLRIDIGSTFVHKVELEGHTPGKTVMLPLLVKTIQDVVALAQGEKVQAVQVCPHLTAAWGNCIQSRCHPARIHQLC